MIQQVTSQINKSPSSFMRQNDVASFFLWVLHWYLLQWRWCLYSSHWGDRSGTNTEQQVGVKAGKRYRFLSGFQRGAITQVFDFPCELCLSRHSINQPGSWSMNCTGCWVSVMSRFRHKTGPVGGSSRDRWGLGLMSLQQQHSHFIRFLFQKTVDPFKLHSLRQTAHILQHPAGNGQS